jgi:uncharacterized protein YdaL
MIKVLLFISIFIEDLNLVSFESLLKQTGCSLPIKGIPVDVPVPKNVTFKNFLFKNIFFS